MAAFEEFIRTLGPENLEYILPFLLVFTLVFAILQKTKILGEQRNFNVIVALVMGASFVVPSVTNRYPPGQDPVMILNSALPGVAITAVSIIMVLLLVGMFGKKLNIGADEGIGGIAVLFSVGAVAIIFAIAAGWVERVPWWLSFLTYPQNQTMIVALLVFGLIIWFIVRDPEAGKDKDDSEGFLQKLGKLVED